MVIEWENVSKLKVAKSGNPVGKWSVFLMICVYLNMLIDKSKAFSYYIFYPPLLAFLDTVVWSGNICLFVTKK